MKRIYLLICLLIPVMVLAQDVIVMKDKSTISARVVQEDKELVLYILQDDNDKKVQELAKDGIKKVKYEKKPASTNLIKIVHDSLVNEFLLNDIINQFIEAGYMIESFDNKYYTVSTNSVKEERFTAEIVDNTANFRCFYFRPDIPYATAMNLGRKQDLPEVLPLKNWMHSADPTSGMGNVLWNIRLSLALNLYVSPFINNFQVFFHTIKWSFSLVRFLFDNK